MNAEAEAKTVVWRGLGLCMNCKGFQRVKVEGDLGTSTSVQLNSKYLQDL
jgi:hypothetical protein